MLVDAFDASIAARFRTSERNCIGLTTDQMYPMIEIIQFPAASPELRNLIEPYVLLFTSARAVHPAKGVPVKVTYSSSSMPFTDRPLVDKDGRLLGSNMCMWYETGFENLSWWMPHFLSSYKQYEERFLKLRLVDGKLEYEFTPTPLPDAGKR